ncbi:MAG: hypothetical protein V2A62_01675 [Candidatus Woesearchaeota archaeon]
MPLDFFIPERYRGRTLTIPVPPDQPKHDVKIIIPKEASYLDINPLEEEDEFLGCQDLSNHQQLNYYSADQKYFSSQEFQGEIVTEHLMSQLEKFLMKQY